MSLVAIAVILSLMTIGSLGNQTRIDWKPIISKITGMDDVISRAMTVADLTYGEEISNQDLLRDVQNSIDNANIKTLVDRLLILRIEKIDTAVLSIRSCLTDFKAYLNADDTHREQLKKQYTDRFSYNNVITHIRFLRDLLTYSVPGTSGKALITVFETNANCNITKVKNFKSFYAELLSDGISLEVLHMMFIGLNPTETLNIFSEQIVSIHAKFSEVEGACWNPKSTCISSNTSVVQMSVIAFIMSIVGTFALTMALTFSLHFWYISYFSTPTNTREWCCSSYIRKHKWCCLTLVERWFPTPKCENTDENSHNDEPLESINNQLYDINPYAVIGDITVNCEMRKMDL